MKRFFTIFCLMAFVATLFSFKTLVKPARVLFFGDSITEAGVRPGGYIVKMGEALTAKGQSEQYELIGKGIGGNKVYDLFLRLESDVLELKPDVVVIYVGVNDVWHKRLFGTGTDADKFPKFYEAMIKKIKANGTAKVILCTPACIGEKTDCTNTLDGELNQYSQIIRDLAERNDCALCDLRVAFQTYQQSHNPDNLDKNILTTDGVHLNDAGNKLVADLLLEKI